MTPPNFLGLKVAMALNQSPLLFSFIPTFHTLARARALLKKSSRFNTPSNQVHAPLGTCAAISPLAEKTRTNKIIWRCPGGNCRSVRQLSILGLTHNNPEPTRTVNQTKHSKSMANMLLRIAHATANIVTRRIGGEGNCEQHTL